MKAPKLIQRKRDGFYILIYYVDGKRVRKSLGTRDSIEANIQFSRLTGLYVPTTTIKAAELPTPTPQMKSRTLFMTAVNKFILAKWGVKDAWTAKRKPQCYARPSLALSVLRRLQAFGSIRYVQDVSFDVLQGYVSHITLHGGIDGKGMASASIVGQIGFIRRFLKYCVNMEYIVRNEADKLDKVKRKRVVRYSFSKEEVKMILGSCLDRFRPFFELMLETGLRPCDMWKLTPDDFPDGDSLRIVQNKTGDQLEVPISERAQEIIGALPHRLFPWADREWSRQHGEMDQRVAVQNELRICFAGDRKDGCIERGKAICRPKGIRLHTFRHTFAMWKLAEECPIEVIKDLMGHSTLEMAEIYASRVPKNVLAKWVRKSPKKKKK